ncbi:hypothetical protein HO173_010158 [Letharia columbiana]|uniref:HD/PDEase domain-containing protein n=1 Tax=Letharia columbiana TaxID=112416 RepID=A0A8H6FN65_9LECA|nr:uncharacterized protein HO173_010158 [Letharia columbiana]KAF6231626.1 hypothetical protein HO173_010158 [Letharia columbiana]
MCPPSSFNSSSTSPITNAATISPPNIVPPSPICTSTYHLVRQSLPPAIFNHSLRVYLYTQALAQCANSPWVAPDRLPLLFVACLFHDMGCATENDGPQRFEVCGADAAAGHLRKFEVNDTDVQEVWTAISLHTSPGIAERITPLARLVRLAVLMDFNELGKSSWITESELEVDEENYRRSIEERFPRLSAEKVLGDIVVEQGMRQSTKAPAASWAGVMVRAAKEEPEWEGINKAF